MKLYNERIRFECAILNKHIQSKNKFEQTIIL